MKLSNGTNKCAENDLQGENNMTEIKSYIRTYFTFSVMDNFEGLHIVKDELGKSI